MVSLFLATTLRRWAAGAVIGGASIVAADVACYSPTEVRLELSTDSSVSWAIAQSLLAAGKLPSRGGVCLVAET